MSSGSDLTRISRAKAKPFSGFLKGLVSALGFLFLALVRTNMLTVGQVICNRCKHTLKIDGRGVIDLGAATS